MSKSKPRITIVGLGLIGGSIGLALREAEVAATVIGHDKASEASSRAKKMGAVDKTHWRLLPACEESDLVVLSTPLDGIRETLADIGPYLKPGSIVIDTASLKAPVLAWAEEHLAEGVHFVGTDPIIAGAVDAEGGIGAARADLFEQGLFCLTPSPRADSEAVKQVTNLVAILGASPVFFDPHEHDGLVAAVDHLPSLVSLALLDTVVHQPAWREIRKVAGPSFELMTRPAVTDPDAQSELSVANRDNLVRWLDSLTASLASIRQNLVDEEGEALAERFDQAQMARGEWRRLRGSGHWGEGAQTEMPPKPNLMDTFLGSFWRRKPPKKES